jgi:hypothetical protein
MAASLEEILISVGRHHLFLEETKAVPDRERQG